MTVAAKFRIEQHAIPSEMKAWVLDGPNQVSLKTKPVPAVGLSEVLVRVDAIAICATDIEILHHGSPARVDGQSPFNKNFTFGHEYMGTVVALGPHVDEYAIHDRVTVEVHAGCGQCKRCRQGMYTACLNYGFSSKRHRANGFTTDGGFAQFVVNNINTLVKVPDDMSDEEATLVVTAGTSMYGFTELGGLVAGESVAVIGPGPIGLLAVGVAKALGADPVILVGTRESRLKIGQSIGADVILDSTQKDAVAEIRSLTNGIGVDYVIDCAGVEQSINDAIRMTNRGGKICLAAFPHDLVNVNLAEMVRNNIYMYGIRGEGKSATHRAMALMRAKRFDATLIHTHTFGFNDLPKALHYAENRVDGAIKVVLKHKYDAIGAA